MLAEHQADNRQILEVVVAREVMEVMEETQVVAEDSLVMELTGDPDPVA
jgi:hypothetical protein